MKNIFFTIFVVLFAFNNQASALTKDHLEPPKSVYNTPNPVDGYYLKVKNVLVNESTANPYARLIVLPSFQPEWMVTVNKPSGETAEVEYLTINEQVWANKNPDNIKTIKKIASIPSDVASDIQMIWESALKDARYPDKLTAGVDGATYLFSAFVEGKNYYVGEKWTPAENTFTGALTHLGELLKRYTETNSEEELLEQIKATISEIKQIL